MSNRRRPRNTVRRREYVLAAPDIAEQYAATWRCPNCGSEYGRTSTDRHGIQHAIIRHDDDCPYLNGATS